MNKDVFDLKAIGEFTKFMQEKVQYNKEPDIYPALVKQMMLQSYCEN